MKNPQAADMLSISHDDLNTSIENGCLNTTVLQREAMQHPCQQKENLCILFCAKMQLNPFNSYVFCVFSLI